jgi:hypothetical protein
VACRGRAVAGLLAGILATLPAVAGAGTYAARVRWQPSTDPMVVGYDVFKRGLSGAYGAPESGQPVRAGDGTWSLVVSGLDVRTDYAFAVTASTGSGAESGLSNEVRILYGQVAPLVDSDDDGLSDAAEDANMNRAVDPGETDPDQADTDGDGIGDANDACQGSARGAAVNGSGCSCAQVTCADADPCTADSCTAGVCQHGTAPDGTSCGDGNACDGAETCQGGSCVPGTALSCGDGDPCTTDSCSATSGCRHTPIPVCVGCTTGAACDDADPCTTDSCTAGVCQHGAAPEGASCSDGNACNGAETCRAGTCVDGPAPSCDDGNPCTADACDQGLGRCAHRGLAGCCASDADCADVDACTASERCESGACASDPIACPEPGPCTSAWCDPVAGCTAAPHPEADTCVAPELCARELRLAVHHLAIRPASRRRQRLVGRASFLPTSGLDPTRSGVSVEVSLPSGALLYAIPIAPADFRADRRRRVFRFAPRERAASRAAAAGLRKLTLRVTSVATDVRLALLGENAAVPTARGLGWLLRLGEQCVRDADLSCSPFRRTGMTCE